MRQHFIFETDSDIRFLLQAKGFIIDTYIMYEEDEHEIGLIFKGKREEALSILNDFGFNFGV